MLAGARPLVDLLWMRELEAEPLDTPERKAGFEARLMAAVGLIKHPGVKKAYERELRDRLYWHCPRDAKWGERRRQGRRAGSRGMTLREERVHRPGPTGLAGLRLVVRAIESPRIMEQAPEALAKAVFDDPDVDAIRDAAFDVYNGVRNA